MISRRSLILSLASMPVGLAIGAGAYITNRSQPSIRVIGSRNGMLILLETGSERVLVLAGEIEDYLWRQRSSLVTIGRERIDAIVATYDSLSTVGIPNLDTHDSTVVFSLQRSLSLPPLSGRVFPVADTMELKVGEAAYLVIRVSPSIESDGAPDFLTVFEAEGTRSVIASSSTTVRNASESGISSLILPGSIGPEDILGVRPELVLATDTERIIGLPRQLLVFSDSAAELLLDDGRVRVNKGQLLS